MCAGLCASALVLTSCFPFSSETSNAAQPEPVVEAAPVQAPAAAPAPAAAVKKNLGDAYYASHVYNPLFFEGMRDMAKEIYKQLGNKIPEYIFIPVGNGTMLIGLYAGFMELGRLPHFVAVQSTKCAPLYEAFKGVEPQPKKTTIAHAIRIEKPKRLTTLVEILKQSGGDVVTVEDKEILQAKKFLGSKGVYVELTSAAALAGAEKFFAAGKPDNYRVVIPMTGSGLKR